MRDLESAFKTAIAGREVLVAGLCFIDYPTTPFRAWTGRGDISWDGETWAGIGDFGGFSSITQRAGPEAATTTLTVNGVSADLVELALLDTSQNRLVEIHMAVMSETAGVWAVVSAWRCFRGRTDVHKIIEGKEHHTIQVSVETFLNNVRRPRVVRYTNAEQQRLFPGDLGMEFAGKIHETPLSWGVPPATVGAPYMGRGRSE